MFSDRDETLHGLGLGKNWKPRKQKQKKDYNSGNYCEPWPFLQVGERVRVEYGPFAGTEGIVLMFKKTYRLVISINMLQRSVAVEIDRDWLKPMTKSVSLTEAKNILPSLGPASKK